MRILRLAVLTACVIPGWCQRVGSPTDDLDKVPVDELFRIQVTSVGRKAQQLSKAPAAVFVLTAEDIRRSGATSIPEALRWVPGLTVLRVDGRSWVVSARGSARLYADKILVMIDGRSLYTPLFAGVIWDSIDVPLDDVEQIEVVRGPGAVMWGPNAVNGVINIITRSAHASKRGIASAATGNELRGSAGLRWGAAPIDKLAYRVWGKMEYRTPAYNSPGLFYFTNALPYHDPRIENLDFAEGRMGFRLDAEPNERNQWMVQGELYKTGRQDPMAYPVMLPLEVERLQQRTHYEGGDFQARWTQTSAPGKENVLQFSYSHDGIHYPYIDGQLHNLTVDYQRRRQTGERNELYWGVGYQTYWDETDSHRYVSFAPRNSWYHVGDMVLRDEWQAVPNRLLLSAGVRVDYNSYRDLDYQPSLRLLYTPNARQSVWMAASRAVRSPSRLDRDVVFDEGRVLAQGFPVAIKMFGSTQMRSEIERSLEAGYRIQSGQRWSVDTSFHWSYYTRLRALAGSPFPLIDYSAPVPMPELTTTATNGGTGRAYGAEVWGTLQLHPRWRLIPAYSYLRESRWLPARTPSLAYWWDGFPVNLRHQGELRSQHDLTRTVQLDLMARARSRDRTFGNPGVVLLGARLSWRPLRATEVSLSLDNLADRHVFETYPEAGVAAIPLRRLFLLKWTQQF